MIKLITIFTAVILSFRVMAGSTRTIDADSIISSDHSKTWSMPATSGTLALSTGVPVQETPSGTVNGTNVTFTLSYPPSATATLSLYQDGIMLVQGSGNDYTISNSTITMGTAPKLGQTLYANYLR